MRREGLFANQPRSSHVSKSVRDNLTLVSPVPSSCSCWCIQTQVSDPLVYVFSSPCPVQPSFISLCIHTHAWAHTCTHTHTPGITLLWFQFCLLNISCYWSRYWSSGLFLTTDGILIERFNDINTPTSGGSLSHDAEQLFQYSATPAWNSNFLLNYQAPLSCFLLYVSVTLSHISLEHLSECFEINNSHPGSLLAHKTPSYELEKGTPSLEKS